MRERSGMREWRDGCIISPGGRERMVNQFPQGKWIYEFHSISQKMESNGGEQWQMGGRWLTIIKKRVFKRKIYWEGDVPN